MRERERERLSNIYVHCVAPAVRIYGYHIDYDIKYETIINLPNYELSIVAYGMNNDVDVFHQVENNI